MTNITENVTSGQTATMTCVRWPIPAGHTGAHAAGLALAGFCAPAAILTHQSSIDEKSAVAHATYQLAPIFTMVHNDSVRVMAVSGIDPNAADKKFDTRSGLKTWSPPPV